MDVGPDDGASDRYQWISISEHWMRDVDNGCWPR